MSELTGTTIQSANFNGHAAFANLKTGYYTIVFPEQNTHRTLRIQRAKYGHFEGKLIISKLTGSDNTSNYTGLAHIENDGSLRIWQKSNLSDAQKRSLTYFLTCILNDATPYGKAYALKSGNCFRCNRLLTNPESIDNGIGPECIKKM